MQKTVSCMLIIMLGVSLSYGMDNTISPNTPLPQSCVTFVSDHKALITLALGITAGYAIKYYCEKKSDNMKNYNPLLICLNHQCTNTRQVYLFAHGLDPRSAAATRQAQSYIDNNILDGLCYTFSFNDSLRSLNFGQTRDCSILMQAYQQVIEKHPESTVILVGVSRGASTILNALATHKDIDFSHVKAVILESPFDHIHSVTGHISKSYVPLVPHSWSQSLLHRLVRHCTLYDVLGTHTIDALESLPEHIELFIGYTSQDATVPPHGTHAIITKLQELGRSVTHCIAPSGRHSTLSTQTEFKEAIDEFLKKHIS